MATSGEKIASGLGSVMQIDMGALSNHADIITRGQKHHGKRK